MSDYFYSLTFIVSNFLGDPPKHCNNVVWATAAKWYNKYGPSIDLSDLHYYEENQ